MTEPCTKIIKHGLQSLFLSLICQKGSFHTPSMAWNDMTSWLATNWCGNSFSTKIKKMCLATTIYHLWKERNCRFHSNSIHREEEIFCSIIDQVRLKLSTYRRVEGNATNRAYQMA